MVKFKKLKTILVFLLIIIIIYSCSAFQKKSSSTIRIKGSDTMLILVKAFSQTYMTTYPGETIIVEGGGSGTGFDALIEGDVDIAMSSRLINSKEAYKMAQSYKSIGLSYLIAKDALSIYLNPANKIESLTTGDLALIFSGRIDNWLVFSNTLGEIEPVLRPETSGTHAYFKLFILKGAPYSEKSIILPTTRDVTQYVIKNSNAIGYGGIAYGDSVFKAPVNGISPTEENVRNDLYPLTRYLYFYTITTPSENVRKFIDWVISPAGQRIVKNIGYFPLWQ